MTLVLVKLQPELRHEIARGGARFLIGLLDGKASHAAFDRAADAWSEIDYRDLKALLEEDDPLGQLFEGEPLAPGLEWTYGPPMYFDPGSTRNLLEAIRDSGDVWPLSDIVAFVERAADEGKGLVVGVN
jgi:hypothetical protein